MYNINDYVFTYIGSPKYKISTASNSTSTITFIGHDGAKVGLLDWSSGVIKFSGDADESAKIFFEKLIYYGGINGQSSKEESNI